MSIIDCHVHLNNYDDLNKIGNSTLSLQDKLDTLIEDMNNNNIIYSILISSYKVNANWPSTSQLIDIVNKNDLLNKIGIVAEFSIDNHNNEDLKNYRQ